ncbi:hypothetical protein BN7_1490 [Wickerhamomyces ciferrii]|uniref:Uncharacterized protein n=1 Tax=Wickerhamomyces ciferrii (strain ATCC 14091 / BCRC 22168 / CBS 111 / JCM 3599 / NBRC 0793 / NRRL Y-1031 F-60-10) TaxID=1206466 RepID=K0KG70_WICCF|nr:uncharacterized protein BN7_1490 [Wickerhamomyces ciferrii]CCH41951.1 hypothetical protein BN7_1490 [Wickerhamomyces ciferrii]
MINTIDTAYPSHITTTINQSPSSSSSSPRNSRCEIKFDQESITDSINSPLNARLMYYNNSKTPQSISQSVSTSPRNSMVQSSFNQTNQRPKPPLLLRSTSLPTIQKQNNNNNNDHINDYKIQSPSSRKSSILTNCTHINDDESNTDQSNSISSCDSNHIHNDLCKRHHHRRESIAIKFNDPIINEPIEQEHAQNDTLFTQLKNYELK